MGPYCNYCYRQWSSCFVERVLADGRWILLATCQEGMAHDRAAVGQTYRTAHNPYRCQARGSQLQDRRSALIEEV